MSRKTQPPKSTPHRSSLQISHLGSYESTQAAFYLSVTYNFMEELIRSKTVPSTMLGKRRVVDIQDLDAYATSVIEGRAA